MSDTATIRADLVTLVRSGLRGAAGEAADAIVQATEQSAQPQGAEGPTAHRQQLDRLCGLLDVIGWADPERQSAVQIDLATRRVALAEGLEVALLVAEDALADEPRVLAERTAGDKAPCQSATERLERVRELSWAIGLRRQDSLAPEASAA